MKTKFFRLQFIFVFIIIGLATATVWHDATEFDIEGKGWGSSQNTYGRFPSSASSKELTAEVLSTGLNTSSGLTVRFQTDAETILVKWTRGHTSGFSDNVAIWGRAINGKWGYVGAGDPEQLLFL